MVPSYKIALLCCLTAPSLCAQSAPSSDSPWYRRPGSYIGVRADAAVPVSAMDDLGYRRGYGASIPFGYHRPGDILGVRFDLGYTRFDGRDFRSSAPVNTVALLRNGDPDVYSGLLNVVGEAPLGENSRVGLFGLVGAGVFHFRNFGRISALGAALGNDVLTTNGRDGATSRTKFGGQVGVGVRVGAGPVAFVLETRATTVFTGANDAPEFRAFFGDAQSSRLTWVPISLGVTFR